MLRCYIRRYSETRLTNIHISIYFDTDDGILNKLNQRQRISPSDLSHLTINRVFYGLKHCGREQMENGVIPEEVAREILGNS